MPKLDEIAFTALCAKIEELIANGTPLTVVAGVSETGAKPENVRAAFAHLEEQGVARLIGGQNRGWSLVRKAAN